jgi:hypothetical protein
VYVFEELGRDQQIESREAKSGQHVLGPAYLVDAYSRLHIHPDV